MRRALGHTLPAQGMVGWHEKNIRREIWRFRLFCKTLPVTSYPTRPADLFECFTVEGRLRAFTQSPATADARPGGAFSWFGGGVTGTYVELQPPHRLVLDWRFSSWEDGVAARVEVDLREPEPGSTTLQLKVSGVPEEDRFGNHDVRLQMERGWQDQVLKRIRQVFGYGA